MHRAAIRKNATGEVRICEFPELPWAEGSLWWWTEGNFGCDCNRYLEFERAGSREDDPWDDDVECSDGKYALVWLEGDGGFHADWPNTGEESDE